MRAEKEKPLGNPEVTTESTKERNPANPDRGTRPIQPHKVRRIHRLVGVLRGQEC